MPWGVRESSLEREAEARLRVGSLPFSDGAIGEDVGRG